MSYRECRSLCEMLRSLNYNRIVSLENFSKPNFELVADILYWLAQKYDPQADISDDINEEKDRVEFMRTIVNLFAVKARIKLNPKKLYQADSDAVTEILKITSLLYKVALLSFRHLTPKPPKRKKLLLSLSQQKSPTWRPIRFKLTKSVILEQGCTMPSLENLIWGSFVNKPLNFWMEWAEWAMEATKLTLKTASEL